MRISERGQITIPKPLRDRFGMNPNVEVEMMPTEQGLLTRERPAVERPVDRVCAILREPGRRGITGSDVVTKCPNA